MEMIWLMLLLVLCLALYKLVSCENYEAGPLPYYKYTQDDINEANKTHCIYFTGV